MAGVEERVAANPAFAADTLEREIRAQGFARVRGLLSAQDCSALIEMYADDARFRSRTDMGRHQFGEGDYAYFARPLPALVETLRQELYARLAPVATSLERDLGHSSGYPPGLDGFLARCHAAGQTRPTPLLLHYRAGGYNRMHQDRYGDVAFPLQCTVFLSTPGVDFQGGEFLLLEQPARSQARIEVIQPERGEAVVFPSVERPVPGARGPKRAAVKHGVARLLGGERFTLGLIFHDAA